MNKEKFFSKNDIKFVILIFFSSIAVLNVLFAEGYMNGHDSDYHMAAINAIIQTIRDGNWFFPKVLPWLGFDMNYGTNLFYAPLSHDVSAYVYLLFSPFKLSLEICMKFVHVMSLFISGLSMFYFIKRVTGNKWSSLVSAIFYISFTYRLSLVVIRDAIAESFIYMFLPLLFWGLYELVQGNRKRFFFLTIVGAVGIILSHTLMATFVVIFCLIFVAFNFKKVFTLANIKSILLACVFIFALTSFYTIPLLIQKSVAQYNVFDAQIMGAYTEFVNACRLSIREMFVIGITSDLNSVSFGISLPIWAMVLYSLYYFKKLNKIEETKVFAVYSLFMGLLVLFVSSSFFDWKIMPQFLKMIQFPWRLVGFVGFFFSIIAGFFIFLFDKKYHKLIAFIACIFVMTIAVNAFNYVGMNKTKLKNDSNISMLYPLWQTMGWQHEYLTKEAELNKEYLAARGIDVKVMKNTAVISNVYRKTPILTFDVSNNDNTSTELELPALYYKGYTIKFTDNNNIVKYIDVVLNDKGLCKINVTGNGHVDMDFTGTKLMISAYYLTVGASLVFLGSFAFIIINKKILKRSNTTSL